MPRYRQVQKEDGSYELVEVGKPGTEPDRSGGFPMVNAGDFQPYRSPIDGTLVTTARAHEEHKRKHNVVEHREFGDDHYKRRQKEREKVFAGKYSRQEQWERKAQINEIINHLERAER